MKRIEAQQIAKQYGKGDGAVTALKGVSFTIDAGEFVAVMGESGSGKSTLLSIVGTLNSPTAGRLMVDDVDVYALANDKRADFRRESIGFVFQNFNLIPYLTLAENVMLPLATIREKRANKRSLALAALDRVGLSQKTDRLPSQISGGEQERVAIARAIVGRPPIILADEPTGNLDSKTGSEIMGIINTLNSEGMTIIMVTHNSFYAEYANRVLRVADGLLTQGSQGRPATPEGIRIPGQSLPPPCDSGTGLAGRSSSSLRPAAGPLYTGGAESQPQCGRLQC